MSETDDFKTDVSRKTKSITIPPSSRATSSVPSIIPGNSENPISIYDSDDDEDFIPTSAKELAEIWLNHAVKEEPKGDVLKSVPVKCEYLNFNPSLYQSIFIISESHSISPEIEFQDSPASISFKKNQRSRNTGKGKEQVRYHGSVVKITSRLSVDGLEVVISLPSTWAVPRDRSATLVDLS